MPGLRVRPLAFAALAAFVLAACGAEDGVQNAEPSVGKAILEYVDPSGRPLRTENGEPPWSWGTLFKVAANTYVTNHHVISDILAPSSDARVGRTFARFRTASGDIVESAFEVVSFDTRRDLALLRLANDTAAPPLPIFVGDIRPGLRVAALGFPGLNVANIRVDTVAGLEPIYSSRGEVNNVAPREFGDDSLPTEAIQHDANIAPGSSGGPLLTLCAAVLGVNTQGVGVGENDQSEFRQSSSHTELAEFLRENNVAFTTDNRACQPGAGVPTALIALGVAVAGVGGAVGLMWLRFRPLLRQLRDAADRIVHPGVDMQEFVLQDGATRIPVSFRPGKSRSYVFGRDPGRADIRLDDEFVSRAHFEVGYEGGPRIRDLGSLNGTTVNGQPVGEGWRPLAPGDRIAAGDFVLELIKV